MFREFAEDNFSINEIFQMNNPDTFFDSAILSALIGSCSFVISQKMIAVTRDYRWWMGEMLPELWTQ